MKSNTIFSGTQHVLSLSSVDWLFRSPNNKTMQIKHSIFSILAPHVYGCCLPTNFILDQFFYSFLFEQTNRYFCMYLDYPNFK